jgi:hypothetical protein
MQNLFPGPVGWKTEVLNKTKEQRVEQQDVLMLFLFPWMLKVKESKWSDMREEEERDLEMQRQEQQLGLDQQG